jgi:hypothetical protein
MKSWTLIASYLWKDTWSRWLEQPSSVLSRVFVGSLLVTVATVILVAFHLLERNLRTRLEAFGVNTIISREPVSPQESDALPNVARADRFQPLNTHGERIRLRQYYHRANTPWHREIAVMSYGDDALPALAKLFDKKTPNVCLSETMPENALVPFSLGRHSDIAIVRRPEGVLRPIVSQQHLFLVPLGWAPDTERLGYVETVVFRRRDTAQAVPHFVAAMRNLFAMEQKNAPQIQSAIAMAKELESLQARQLQWRSAMAGMLGLAVALVFGAIAVLEFRQNSYVSALLRSFGAPGKALYIRQWIENAVLANLAALSAIVLLACFHSEIFALLGFPRDLLNLRLNNPYFSWEIALILFWVNIGAFLSSLSVAIGLRKPVGEILS